VRGVAALFVSVEAAVALVKPIHTPIATGMLAVLVERAATRDELLGQSTASTTASWDQSAHATTGSGGTSS